MKQGAPLISVIIPVFNRSWQLRRALASLQSQSFKDFEVIVCDDGSTEDIASVVKEFEQTLDIGFIQMPNWGGPAKPRNEGLKLAKGEWIAFLDSDDWWDANRLEVVSQYLNNDIDFLYHPLRVMKQAGLEKSREKRLIIGEPIAGNPLRQMLLAGNPVATSGAVIRKSFLTKIGGMSEDKTLIIEDFDCWLRLAELGARFKYLNSILGNYWVGSEAISNITNDHIHAQKLLFLKHSSQIPSSIRKGALARQNYVLGLLYFKMGKSHLAFDSLKLASPLGSWRMLIKRWVMMIISLLKITQNKLLGFWKIS